MQEAALSSLEAGTETALSASLATASDEQLMLPAMATSKAGHREAGVCTRAWKPAALLPPGWQLGVSGCRGPGRRAKCTKHFLQPVLGSELCVCQLG